MTWVAWEGKREVKHETRVEVRFRNGQVAREILPANSWRWKYKAEEHDFDIVAYRKVLG